MAQHLMVFFAASSPAGPRKNTFWSYGIARALIIYGLVLSGLLVRPAGAESLVDPTRPPTATAEQEGEAVAAGSRLQSVIMGPKRKAAVISGQVVALGQKFGDATLIQVSERAVVLRNADDTRLTLELHPAVTKTVIAPKPEKNIAAKKTQRSSSTRALDTR